MTGNSNSELSALSKKIFDESFNYQSLSHEELIEHLVQIHHEYLKLIGSKIIDEANRIITQNTQKNEKLRQVSDLAISIIRELKQHLKSEEDSLFPHFLEAVGQVDSKRIEFEHEESLGAIRQLNRMTDAFTCPYKEKEIVNLYKDIENLCNALYKHIYVEDKYVISLLRK